MVADRNINQSTALECIATKTYKLINFATSSWWSLNGGSGGKDLGIFTSGW